MQNGLSEKDFWDMTIAEILRYIKAKNEQRDLEDKRKAYFDYIQAQTIIKGVAIVFGSKSTMPQLYELYPQIFKQEIEESQKKEAELFKARLKQFSIENNRRRENK